MWLKRYKQSDLTLGYMKHPDDSGPGYKPSSRLAQVVVAQENNESVQQENPYTNSFALGFLLNVEKQREVLMLINRRRKILCISQEPRRKSKYWQDFNFKSREYLTTLDELSASTRERAVSCLKSFLDSFWLKDTSE
ncbi:MAG: hypothetical protein R2883_05815 [Caldisericia bacterium]